MSKSIVQQVTEEVMSAFCDCHEDNFDRRINRRNLNFRASSSVSRDEAVEIMQAACPGGYNEFKAALLGKLPDGSAVLIARESSPAVYVTPQFAITKAAAASRYKADEVHQEPVNGVPSTRLWWD